MRLHHRIEGDGPWVTLAHSLASNLTLFDDLAARLARRHRVLRLDLRGHGASPAPNGPYAMAELAGDAAELLDGLGAAGTAWVGVSLGGMVGLTLALDRPDLVARLVAADTTAGYPEALHAGWRARMDAVRAGGTEAVVDGTLARWFTPEFRAANPGLVRRFAESIAATPAEGFLGCCEAILGYDIAPCLARIACPTLVVVGEADEATTPAMARALADGIPGAALSVIPAAAHQACAEQPELFARTVEGFLQAA
ncbi:alpha/beta fold hydrolase [Lichenibacterium dinghuense]|uniref:alpha/beta fold hydrolase n=1 Tax=Lichenibacterium dinghuense TaxID=2895977 RepID=UPI001F1B3D8E|nr:alpha/beta fold hydrolase [Lichenibacterium sp. 6Y81]